MDASNMLKPMLARGELHTIGATTLDEYRKHIEKDAALERRFQPVFVDEPTRRGDDLDPARPARALRGPPRRPDHRLRARRRRDAQSTATSPTGSCPTRRSTSSTRPRRGSGWRSTRCRSSSTRPSAADPARDRARGAAQGEGRRLEGPPRGAREGARRPRGADRRAEAALGGREGRDRRDPRRRRPSSSSSGPDRAGPARDRLRDGRQAPVRDPARSSRRSSTSRRRRSPRSRARARSCAEEVNADDIAEIVAAWTGIPVTRLMEGEPRSS